MADRLYRAQVTIPLDDGVPENSVTNTWYFDQDDNGVAPSLTEMLDTMLAKLTTFYQAIDGVIFPTSVGAAATVKYYDMRDPEPRVPARTDTITLTPTASGPLPNEVAICLSFSADPLAGVNPQRRRGRVYLGPISGSPIETINGNVYVSAAARTAIAAAASTLATPTDPAGDPVSSVSWAIYSPTTHAGGATLDDSFHDVQSGWVDNAFDTQRRRGPVATARTTWT